MLDGFKEIGETNKELKQVQIRQANETENLTIALKGLSGNIDKGFDIGKRFIGLFKMILVIFLLSVVIFGAIIVYITQVDIKSQYFSISKNIAIETEADESQIAKEIGYLKRQLQEKKEMLEDIHTEHGSSSK